VITRSLGPHPTVSIDVEGPFPIATGDKFLLCSDGLTGPLSPELIGMVLGALPLDDVADTLVDLANLLGGPDNITVVVAEVHRAAKLGSPTLPTASQRSKSRNSLEPTRAAWQDRLLKIVTFGLWKPKHAPPVVQHQIRMQGKAPYRQHACEANSESIATLSDIVRQLEDLETERDWQFDWQDILADRQQAHQAVAKGSYTQAVIFYCSAVRRLMQAVREQQSANPSDSTLNL
jgi:protein phosphatase